MHYAISYKRFSSPKQANGDSHRRQTDLTEEYCKRRRLKLLDTYLDAGLSGFTGANLSDGSALRALLHAAKIGTFKPGTRLIVESLDRLSRREISTAVRLFLDILDTGLVIITLIDGEQVFTKDRVDSDLSALIIAIVYLSRANNESRNRRERALQAQQTARKKARERKIPITAECPMWLTLVGKGDKRHFIIDRDRARIIEHIFNMSASGLGQFQITAFLNQHYVPTFTGRPRWRPGMIGHLLKSQAVVGLFHPCLNVVADGKRRRIPDPEGPIKDYFPAIISDELYKQGRLATTRRLAHRGNRKIPAYLNLVVRIGRCAICGGALHHSGVTGAWTYLRCGAARYKECSNRFGFPYRKLESVLFALDELTKLGKRLTPDGSDGIRSHDRTTRSIRRERKLSGDEQEAHRIEVIDREAFFARLPALRSSAGSSEAEERDSARRALIVEFRRLIAAVVLHSNRTLTIHMRPDAAGYHVVYILDYDGIQGAQVRAPYGTTGLIDRSVLVGLVRPVRSGANTRSGAYAESVWQSSNLDELIKRTRIVHSQDGDWQAMAPDPMQIAQVIGRAEQALGPR
jgi:DNA invertase Pin-like site-specific DNA recombinase